ncbi:MAG: response regulator transcription factor [Bacillota bacterium]
MARVLVIEDEPNIAMVLEEALIDDGHEVTTALNGLAGLKNMRQFPQPDLVLLDLLMPVMDGRTVIETMRAEPELSDIPVIIISGSLPGTCSFPPKGTYQAIFCKPFDLLEVLATVQAFTANRNIAACQG